MSTEGYIYHKSWFADFYIPDGYIYDSSINYPQSDHYQFVYPDSSFIVIGIGSFGDLHVTDIYKYIGKNPAGDSIWRGIKVMRIGSEVGYNFHDYDENFDTTIDTLEHTFARQIVYIRNDIYLYNVVGYVCKNFNDTNRFNTAISLISWKDNLSWSTKRWIRK